MTVLKLFGVLLSFAGATVITLSESSSDGGSKATNRILGDSLTIVSAIFYGVYATFLKYKIPEKYEKHFSMSLFLGFVGLINVVLLVPLFPIFHFTGIEYFAWPKSSSFLLLTLNAILSTFSDF